MPADTACDGYQLQRNRIVFCRDAIDWSEMPAKTSATVTIKQRVVLMRVVVSRLLVSNGDRFCVSCGIEITGRTRKFRPKTVLTNFRILNVLSESMMSFVT